MALTPQQARARLAMAREKMHIATVMARGREKIDYQAGLTAAVLEIIQLLEDALA